MNQYSDIVRSSLRGLPMRYNYDEQRLELVMLGGSETIVAYSTPWEDDRFNDDPQGSVDEYEMELLSRLGNLTSDMFESDDRKLFIKPVLPRAVSTALTEDLDLEGSDIWTPSDGSDREFRYNSDNNTLEYLVDGIVKYYAELPESDWNEDPQYWVDLYSSELDNESDISLDTLDEVESRSRISDTMDNI